MTKILPLIALACLLIGCKSVPQVSTVNGVSVTNFVNVPDSERISKIAGNAAQVGSFAYLRAKPGDRVYFVLANENLKSLINSSNYDAGALSSALSSLPIKELKGEQGAIVVMTAQMIVEDALDSAKDVVTKRELVAAVLFKVQAGIQRALDATAPRSFYLRDLELRLEGLNMPRRYEWRGPEPVQGRLAVNTYGVYTTTEADRVWLDKFWK